MAQVGSLGQLTFKCSDEMVRTFSDLSVDREARWATHDIIGGKPMLEFVGEGLTKVSFKMRFDISLGYPPKVGLDRVKRMLENRKYKTLVIGSEYIGRFVIESISETQKYFDGKGNCLVAEVSVSLTEWAGKGQPSGGGK